MRLSLGWVLGVLLVGRAWAQGAPPAEPVAPGGASNPPRSESAGPTAITGATTATPTGTATAGEAMTPPVSVSPPAPIVSPPATTTPTSASPGAPATSGSEPRAEPPRVERPAPYSLPFGLRPIIPVTVLRLDSVVATYRSNDNLGVTTTILPLVGYRFSPHFMGVARWGLIGNAAPDGSAGVSVPNVALGGIWGLKLPANLRLGFFLGATVPLGTGGAKATDPLTTAATAAGLYSRSAMDNAMFAVNDFTLFPGVDFAYVGHGLTVQVEATVLQLMRVKNEATQTDAFRTNFTAGLHTGFFVTRWLTLTAELRYQRWLSTPDAVAADETLRDNLSLAVGPRFHVKWGRGFLRPGLAYNAGLAGRLSSNSYHMVLIDIPYVM